MTQPADASSADAVPEPKPHRRAHTFSRSGVLLELAIVTAGVLIALSVDTVRQWRTHESLAAEARATMLSEVTQNQKALNEALVSFRVTQKTFIRALRDARARLNGERGDSTSDFDMSVKTAGLSSAAYTTAEITGALGYMKYDDVRRFAGAYDMQRRFESLEEQIQSDVWAIGTPVLFGGVMSGKHPQELEAWKRDLEHLLAKLMELQGFGQGLRQSYNSVLKK